MALLFLLAILALPFVEIAVFIRIGDDIGVIPTLAATIATAAFGLLLLRIQGLSTLNQVRRDLDEGRAPLRAGFDGACLLIAGVLLLIPGFVTDAVGLLLFLPPVRSLLFALALRNADVTIVAAGQGRPSPRHGYDIDGEFRDLKEDHTGPPRLDHKTDREQPPSG